MTDSIVERASGSCLTGKEQSGYLVQDSGSSRGVDRGCSISLAYVVSESIVRLK